METTQDNLSSPKRLCKRCSDPILKGGPKRLYCLQEKTRECPVCETEYSVICQSKDRCMPKTCSSTCQHIQAERTRQGIRDRGDYAPMPKGYKLVGRFFEDRVCDGCHESYTPTMPTQRFCAKTTVETCLFCLESFNPRRPCDPVEQLFCSLLCANLHKGDSKLFKDKLEEFKNIDEWAIRFFEAEGRKPNHVDTMIYFGARIPARSDKELFSIPPRSPFEDTVLAEIEKHVPEEMVVLREKQPLRYSGRRYELDLWIPDLKIAFEVQDFATHSRDKEDEPCQGYRYRGGLKKGPAYHTLKRVVAKEQLDVKLYEIWQDEILDGSYREIVRLAIVTACA